MERVIIIAMTSMNPPPSPSLLPLLPLLGGGSFPSGSDPGTHFVILSLSIAGGFGLIVGRSVDCHVMCHAGSVACRGTYSVLLQLSGLKGNSWEHDGDRSVV